MTYHGLFIQILFIIEYFCYTACVILFIALLVYFILLLLISFFYARKQHSLEDFFLASRNLPPFLVYVSLAASWLGATSTLVSVDEAYNQGISAFWVMGMPAVLTVLVFVFLFARPIRKLPITTLPDLVEMRYGKTVRHLAAIVIVWYMILLAASQMVALGNFLRLFLGTSYIYALILGTTVVLVYSVLGGFFSVVVTDGLQFFLLIAGLLGVFVFILGKVSWHETSLIVSELAKTNYFDFFHDINRNLWIVISFTCAWIISPIAWQRIQAARSEKAARQGLLAAALTFILVYGIIVFIGVFSLALFSGGGLEHPLLSTLIDSHLGFILRILLFVAIVAAIMSTMDTAINTGALSVTRDIYQRMFGGGASSGIISISRVSTFIIAFFSFLIATRVQSILKTLGLASEVMTASFFIPGIVMLFMHRKMPFAGLFSVLLGGSFAFFSFLNGLQLVKAPWPEWPYSIFWGLLISLVGFLVGAKIDLMRAKR